MTSPRILLAGLALCATSTYAQTTIVDGAEIYSKDTVRFGRWEMRMQVAATPGSVSSFFTYHNESYKGLPEPWREIDIEVLGKNGKAFQSNLITGDAGDKSTSEEIHTSTDDLSKGYHTYVLDWTPDSIVWRLDGVNVRKTVRPDQQVIDLADHPQTYRMNLWASNSIAWVGKLDTTKLPIVQSVNWMSYSAYTPGKGPGGSNFTPVWTDDFNTFDTRRWAKGDWTFETNLADFATTNAKTSGGYLMLILSSKNGPGSITPPVDVLGNTKPTKVEPRTQPLSSLRVLPGALLLDLGEAPTEVSLHGLDGRQLARAVASGVLRLATPKRGLQVLRVGDRSSTVLVP